jgi:hypothetical protein
MDLLQEKISGIEPNKFLQEAKVLDKEAAFANLSEPVRTSGYEIDSNGNKTGYFRVGETQIVNLAASTNSKEFRDQLEGEYARVFKSGRSVSQIQDYLYGIGVSAGEEFLKLDPTEQKEIFNNALTNHLFKGRFDERVELSETVNQLAVKLTKGDERSEQLLAAANDAGIVNPLTNSDYRIGDTIYVREKLESRDKRTDEDNTQVIGLYKLLQDKGRDDVKKQLVNVPITIKDRGKFLVDSSGQFRLVSGTDPRLYPIVSADNFFEALNDAVKTE